MAGCRRRFSPTLAAFAHTIEAAGALPHTGSLIQAPALRRVLRWPIDRCLLSLLLIATAPSQAAESIWIEAEHLDGIKGYCWPMGKPEMKKTNGHWGLSGPGWAAEWNQGGESGFLSIAAGADDDKAVATKTIEIPADGKWFVWVRYGDWREKTERFQIQLEQDGRPAVDRQVMARSPSSKKTTR